MIMPCNPYLLNIHSLTNSQKKVFTKIKSKKQFIAKRKTKV